MKNIPVILVILAFLPICVSAGTAPKHVVLRKKPIEQFDKVFFPKIKDYKVKLECISLEQYFTAGDLAKLTFSLHNLGLKPLVVYEWMEREPDNLRLYYYRLKEGQDDPPPIKEFTPLIPDVGKKPKRMTLELQPRTSVLVGKLLIFIRSLDIKKPTKFVVFAELNLKSISARSEFVKITVLPRGRIGPVK